MEEQGLIKQIEEAAEGLWYPSETDAPFVSFVWQNLREVTVEKLLVVTRHKPDAPVQEITPEAFFEPLTREAAWMDDDERESARKFQNLQTVLLDLLGNVRVFRVGATDIDVYVVGKTLSGACAGVSTKIVET